MLRVTLFAGIEGGEDLSMVRYAKELSLGLSRYVDVEFQAMPRRHLPLLRSKWARFVLDEGNANRYFFLPSFAARTCGKFNHILDHSNACILRKLPRGIRSIVTCHDIIGYYYTGHPLILLEPLYLLWRFLSIRSLRLADALIADSEFTKRDLVTKLGLEEARIHVVHLGVSGLFRPQSRVAARLQLQLPEEIPIVLTVSSHERRKNMMTLVRAMQQLQEQVPGVILIKIGTERESCIRLINTLGLERRIILRNRVDDRTLRLFYSAADVFVLPSLYEGFGMPALEAMACGCPVVASRSGALPDVVGGAGLLVDPLAPQDIAQALASVLRTVDLREGMAERGLWRAAEFSWRRCVEATLNVYRGVFNW